MSPFVLLAFAFGLLIGLAVSAIVLVVFVIQNEKHMAELDIEIAMLESQSHVVLDCMGEYWCQMHDCSAYECDCAWQA